MAEAPHREWRERLGAYTLGQLSEPEELAVRAHLEGCPDCRDEALSLTPVARRLSLGSPELIASAPEPPRDLGDRVVARVGRARRSERRRRRRTAIAVAVAGALGVGGAAAAAAVVLDAGESTRPAVSPSETVAFRDLPRGVRMRATVAPRAWGTSVAVAVDGEPAGVPCTVWLRRADGTRVPAGSFRYVERAAGTRVALASSLPRSDAVAVDLQAGSYTYTGAAGLTSGAPGYLQRVIVDYALYEDGVRHGGKLPLDHLFETCHGREAFVWIGLHEPTQEEFDAVRREFHLHELAVEDAINAHQRPKLEVYGDTLFVVLKPASYVEPDDVEFGEILLFVGESFVVSVRHGVASSLRGVRAEIEGRRELLRNGPGAVLHAIVDHVVDDYQPVIQELDNDITELEADVFSPEEHTYADRIYKLKREVLEFRQAVVPLVIALERLGAGRYRVIQEDIRPYFRDVEDHVLRVVGQLEGYSELLTSALEAGLIQLQVRQAEAARKQGDDVRKISAWAAIIAIPTLVSGIYGMNFDHMPELHTVWGYPAALALMALVCAAVYLRLKRSGWL